MTREEIFQENQKKRAAAMAEFQKRCVDITQQQKDLNEALDFAISTFKVLSAVNPNASKFISKNIVNYCVSSLEQQFMDLDEEGHIDTEDGE